MTSAPSGYDLLLKGVNLLDPAQGIDGRRTSPSGAAR